MLPPGWLLCVWLSVAASLWGCTEAVRCSAHPSVLDLCFGDPGPKMPLGCACRDQGSLGETDLGLSVDCRVPASESTVTVERVKAEDRWLAIYGINLPCIGPDIYKDMPSISGLAIVRSPLVETLDENITAEAPHLLFLEFNVNTAGSSPLFGELNPEWINRAAQPLHGFEFYDFQGPIPADLFANAGKSSRLIKVALCGNPDVTVIPRHLFNTTTSLALIYLERLPRLTSLPAGEDEYGSRGPVPSWMGSMGVDAVA